MSTEIAEQSPDLITHDYKLEPKELIFGVSTTCLRSIRDDMLGGMETDPDDWIISVLPVDFGLLRVIVEYSPRCARAQKGESDANA